jgi:Ca2+-binding RTX toxin-like protein
MLAYIDLNESEFNILDASAFPSGAIVIGQGTVAGVPDPLDPNFEFSRRFDLPFLRSDGVLEVFGDDSAETITVTQTVGVDVGSELAAIVYTEEPSELGDVLVFGNTSAAVENLLDQTTIATLDASLAGLNQTLESLQATLSILMATGDPAAVQIQSTIDSLNETAGRIASAREQLRMVPLLIDDEVFVQVTRSDGYKAYVPQAKFSGISIIGGAGNDVIDARGTPTFATVWIEGGVGNDTIHGANGRSTLVGGAGNDRLFAYGPTGFADGGEGTDILQTGSVSGGWVIRNMEVITTRLSESRLAVGMKLREVSIRSDILAV